MEMTGHKLIFHKRTILQQNTCTNLINRKLMSRAGKYKIDYMYKNWEKVSGNIEQILTFLLQGCLWQFLILVHLMSQVNI